MDSINIKTPKDFLIIEKSAGDWIKQGSHIYCGKCGKSIGLSKRKMIFPFCDTIFFENLKHRSLTKMPTGYYHKRCNNFLFTLTKEVKFIALDRYNEIINQSTNQKKIEEEPKIRNRRSNYILTKKLPDADVGTIIEWVEEENRYRYPKSDWISPDKYGYFTGGQVTGSPDFFKKQKNPKTEFEYEFPITDFDQTPLYTVYYNISKGNVMNFKVLEHTMWENNQPISLQDEFFISGFIKWDGCCEIKFGEDGVIHFCGEKESQYLEIVMTHIWAIANRALKLETS